MKLFWWEKASAQTLKSEKRTKFIFQKNMNQKVVKIILLLLIFIFLNMKWWFCINWLIKNYSSSPNGSKSMAEWAIDSDAMRTRGTIFLVKSKWLVRNIEEKTTLATKTRFSHHCVGFQSQCFSLLGGYNI